MENNIIYFKLCNDFYEYNKIKTSKYTKSKVLNKIKNKITYYKYMIMKEFNIMKKIEKNDNEQIYISFYNDKNKIKALYRINKKIENILINNKKIKIIVSKEIKKLIKENKNNVYIRILKEIEANTRKDKRIYQNVIKELVKNIISLKKEKLEEQSIYILVNSDNIKNRNIIEEMVPYYKMINIVTKNIKKYKEYEIMAEEKMEPISVLNNKRKSLAKAKYIINIDFESEEILKYNINRNSIIFNISDNKIENLKGFEGIIINNIIIEEDNEFDIRDEYNLRKVDAKMILEKINNYKYTLEGKHGKIEFSELLKNGK